jgi:5-methyltetrahydrofolate--homocysteine methyltransferase
VFIRVHLWFQEDRGSAVLIIAERINTSRKRIGRAVRDRDAEFIRREAVRQAEAGASYIDANAGTSVANELDDLVWLTETVQDATDVPVCLDSANPKALEAALAVHKGNAMINSITAVDEMRLSSRARRALGVALSSLRAAIT